jgi:hypothetical protein
VNRKEGWTEGEEDVLERGLIWVVGGEKMKQKKEGKGILGIRTCLPLSFLHLRSLKVNVGWISAVKKHKGVKIT